MLQIEGKLVELILGLKLFLFHLLGLPGKFKFLLPLLFSGFNSWLEYLLFFAFLILFLLFQKLLNAGNGLVPKSINFRFVVMIPLQDVDS